MRLDGGGFEFVVSQQLLDDFNVGPAFEWGTGRRRCPFSGEVADGHLQRGAPLRGAGSAGLGSRGRDRW